MEPKLYMYMERILQVIASDLDSPPNAALTYSIVKGDEEKHFSMDSKSGNITVNRLLDREQVSGRLYRSVGRKVTLNCER